MGLDSENRGGSREFEHLTLVGRHRPGAAAAVLEAELN